MQSKILTNMKEGKKNPNQNEAHVHIISCYNRSWNICRTKHVVEQKYVDAFMRDTLLLYLYLNKHNNHAGTKLIK